MNERLEALLGAFEAMADPGPYDCPWSHTHEGGRHGFHVVFGSMVHGDEIGSLPAMVRVVEELRAGKRSFGGRASLFVGNVEAGRADRRFLQSDLNRVFTDDPPDTLEGRRARQLVPLLSACDLFLDLHQTILATRSAFYIFPWNRDGWLWARAIQGAPVWITRHPGQAFTTGARCADEYVRMRGLPGITLELGQKGFDPGAEERAYQAITRTLELIDAIAEGRTTLEGEAMEQPEIGFYHTVHREPFGSADHCLREGLTNFEPVRAGDRVSAEGTPEMVAPFDGLVVFPKYPERDAEGAAQGPLPGEIYRIIAELEEHPETLYAT